MSLPRNCPSGPDPVVKGVAFIRLECNVASAPAPVATPLIAFTWLRSSIDTGRFRVLSPTTLSMGTAPATVGSAAVTGVAPLTVAFPITGGDLDDALAGRILHEGSGVSLQAGGITLALENFIIDTTDQLILGDASLDGTLLAEDLALFSFDLSTVTVAALVDLADPALTLSLTAGAAGALTSVFGAPDLTGAPFGLAATAPAFADVPEPGALMLFGLGVVGLAAGQRRRPATARSSQ